MYTVQIHDTEQQKQFPTRHQAVRAAKEISEETHRPVMVLNEGRYERLMFRRGELLEGVFVTRDRRRKMGPLS